MPRSAGGRAGRVLILVLLAAGAAVVWLARDELADFWAGLRGDSTEVSPELAARADDKLASLGEEAGPASVALNESELQSLIEYRWAGFLPADVADPRVGVSDGRVSLRANVATARFGEVSELREIVAFLPDTTSLHAVGSFVPLDSGRVALQVHELGAASIPVPRQLIPRVLSRFRGSGGPGVAPNAVAVPLPPGISNVFVSGDSVVFVASRAPSE